MKSKKEVMKNLATVRHKKITIQKFTSYEDEFHITKCDWKPYKTIWANVNSLYGKEFWEAKQCNYENVLVFTIRYSKDVADINSREYRIKWQDRIFDIISVDNVQFSNTWIKIKAKEVVK